MPSRPHHPPGQCVIPKTWHRDFRFLKSVRALQALPADQGREVLFVGRSNAGKSSVLNALLERRSIARVSKTPGCTRMLNFFIHQDGSRIVDAPGYGFARVRITEQQHWAWLFESYLALRHSLAGIVLVMDVRHPLQENDQKFLHLCQSVCTVPNPPMLVLLNKADKCSRATGSRTLHALTQAVSEDRLQAQLFSARARQGVDAVRAILYQWLH